MKLNCIIITRHDNLVAILSNYIKLNNILELINTDDQTLDSLEKALPPIDILFFDITEDCDSDFIKILSLSYLYKSLVLIISNIELNIEPHILPDIDYLFKPFNQFQFNWLINKIEKKVWEIDNNELDTSKYFFFQNADDEREYIRCSYEEITVIEIANKCLKIHTAKRGTFKTTMSISRMQSKTQTSGAFLRVHRSFLIAKERIEGFKGYTVQVAEYNERIKIGATYYKHFIEHVNLKMIR